MEKRSYRKKNPGHFISLHASNIIRSHCDTRRSFATVVLHHGFDNVLPFP